MEGLCCGPGYASPSEAIRAPSEKLLYTIAIYTGTGIQKPDYLATIDVDPKSESYSNVVHRLEMPGIGDELHHMGWNACSSCHDDKSMREDIFLFQVLDQIIFMLLIQQQIQKHLKYTKLSKGPKLKLKLIYQDLTLFIV